MGRFVVRVGFLGVHYLHSCRRVQLQEDNKGMLIATMTHSDPRNQSRVEGCGFEDFRSRGLRAFWCFRLANEGDHVRNKPGADDGDEDGEDHVDGSS